MPKLITRFYIFLRNNVCLQEFIPLEIGISEDQVLTLLRKLVEDSTIRRFGASIKHQRTGYNNNAMVAWIIDENLIDYVAAVAIKSKNISQCYYRPSSASDWPYTLFTMIHGKTEKECLDVVEELRRTTVLNEYAILESIQELKKISMTYFDEK